MYDISKGHMQNIYCKGDNFKLFQNSILSHKYHNLNS